MENLETKLSNEKKIIKAAEKIINKENLGQNTRSVQNTNHEKKASHMNKTKSKKLILLFFICVIIFIFILFSFIFGLIASKSNKIISGISINGIDISNLTKDESIEKLNSQFSNNLSKEINLTHGDYSTVFDVSTINPKYNIENAVDNAFSIGRSEDNIFANNFKIISTFFNNYNINIELEYDKESLNTAINNINNELPDKVINSSYSIEDNNLIISNSSNGYRIKNDEFEKAINSAILSNTNSIEIPVEQYEAEGINIEAIYNEIHKDPVNASFSTNPFEVHKEEYGLDFAISLDEAKKLVSQVQESYSIPLKVLKPQVTIQNLSQEAFPDLLATYSTTYSTGNKNRSTNISLATNSVNGYVLMPNETFSYNDTVGQRTAARGYKEAGVYLNGEVTTGLGGGICQVSSTLYNAVLLANLEIVDRSNHTFEPAYVPAGQDATVSWGSPDFKFKNNRNYPIKIVATAGGGRVTFNIYGLKTDDDYEVKIISNKIGTVPFSTQYQESSSLPAGTQKITQSGSNGCKTQTYKVLYKNGVEVSRTLINSDTYKPHNQVVMVGTGTVSKPAETQQNATQQNSNQQNQAQQSQSQANQSKPSETPSVEITSVSPEN